MKPHVRPAVGASWRPREPLLREALGRRLRLERAERGLTLVEAAQRAGVSPQYLSEVERGLKEPSSEMIAAIIGALGLTLVELTTLVVIDLSASTLDTGVVPSLDRGGAPVVSRLTGPHQVLALAA